VQLFISQTSAGANEGRKGKNNTIFVFCSL